MVRPQVTDGGDALQELRVAANILNMQWTADKRWSSSLEVVFVVHFILSAWSEVGYEKGRMGLMKSAVDALSRYPANSSILIHDGVLPGKQIGIFVNMGLGHWCPLSYLFYNLLFFLILLWAVHHKESDEPMQMAVAVNAVCLVLDVMVISLYFPRSNEQVVHVVVTGLERIKEEDTNVTVPDSLLADGSERFSCGMAILNLIIRPFTTLVLYRIYVERANAVGAPLPTIFGGTAQRGPYEDIVGAVHQSVPHTDIPSPVEYAPSSKMPPPYHS
ncbi:hypothetical protein B7P43_G11047 [Cryptotermes secundus]|uniref:Uncharacterized protein n=1 Tax=Cryptotermes secundus TaxID=105785 RepID=A0A2J7RFI1_9NEOP|nr:hypothetical protein B7P43_G11047 [Cryptotermes secundus]